MEIKPFWDTQYLLRVSRGLETQIMRTTDLHIRLQQPFCLEDNFLNMGP